MLSREKKQNRKQNPEMIPVRNFVNFDEELCMLRLQKKERKIAVQLNTRDFFSTKIVKRC